MNEIVTEQSGTILRVQLNRAARKNAMTSSMYIALAEVFAAAGKDERTHVVLWHGAGDAFCAGNDVEDFLKNPPGPWDPPQAHLMNVLIDFPKPLIAAVHGAAIGGGATMLTHCDFVYAAENTKFQLPFVDLALVPEFGSSYSISASLGYMHAAELLLLGLPFDAKQAADWGFVTRVVPQQSFLATASETAEKLAAKSAGALQACKRLIKRASLEQIKEAIRIENEEFVARVRSPDAKEALTAFLQERKPNFRAA